MLRDDAAYLALTFNMVFPPTASYIASSYSSDLILRTVSSPKACITQQ